MRELSSSKLGAIDALERNYANHYTVLGLTLLPVPNFGEATVEWLKKVPFDGVLLTGGNNISSQRYGQTGIIEEQSNERDKTEYSIMDYVLYKGIPLLGVCRGAQLINVYFGGSLTNELKTQENGIQHVASNHDIILNDDELVKKLGENKQVVNSYHNQSIGNSNLATSLRSFAIATDGTIEGLYHPEHNLAGIMWHPERDSPSKRLDNLIINLFVQHELYWGR